MYSNMEPVCMAGSHTNILLIPTNLIKNPHWKKNRFLFCGESKSASRNNIRDRALIQNRPKTGKIVDFSKSARFFWKNFRVQHVVLTVRRPKHPSLVWCTPIFLCKNFQDLSPEILIEDTIQLYERTCENI